MISSGAAQVVVRREDLSRNAGAQLSSRQRWQCPTHAGAAQAIEAWMHSIVSHSGEMTPVEVGCPRHRSGQSEHMHDGKKLIGKAADRASREKVDAGTAVPLCRYEELALRENRLREAAARRATK